MSSPHVNIFNNVYISTHVYKHVYKNMFLETEKLSLKFELASLYNFILLLISPQSKLLVRIYFPVEGFKSQLTLSVFLKITSKFLKLM